MLNLNVFVLGCLMLTYSCNGSMEEIVGELQRELQQLKMKTAHYDIEMQALRISSANEIQTLKTSIASCENELQTHKIASADEIQALSNSAISSANEIEALKTASTKEIMSLKAQISSLKTERLNAAESSQALNRRFVLGTNSFAEKPAFSVSLDNHATGLGNHQTIIFDNIFANDLGGYSDMTGVFTAPLNGTYFFTASVMSQSGKHLESEICLNGASLVYMYSFDTYYEQGTNSVILVLKTGDRVWVRHTNTPGSTAYGGHWSTFSGFML
ncbi:Complement C1q tumor necrosis factor-related protein 6 [Mactra antiquata]